MIAKKKNIVINITRRDITITRSMRVILKKKAIKNPRRLTMF